MVLGSATLAFAPSRAWRVVGAAARALWLAGVVMFIRHAAGADELAWVDAEPAVIAVHILIVSLWISVITTATLVLWRDRTSHVRGR